MKVILLQNVPNVGHQYEVKDVSDGYAANFLFPRGLAETASTAKVQALAQKREQAERERAVQEELLNKNFDALKEVAVTISAPANEQGHLFKGIHSNEISDALKEQHRIIVPVESIILPEPLKEIGEHSIALKHGEKKGSLTVTISAEE